MPRRDVPSREQVEPLNGHVFGWGGVLSARVCNTSPRNASASALRTYNKNGVVEQRLVQCIKCLRRVCETRACERATATAVHMGPCAKCTNTIKLCTKP